MKLKLTALIAVMLLGCLGMRAADNKWKHDIYVAQDGSGDYKTITEALEGIRAYMEYVVTVHIADGVYKEKVVIPSWLKTSSLKERAPKAQSSPLTTTPTSTRWALSAPTRSGSTPPT